MNSTYGTSDWPAWIVSGASGHLELVGHLVVLGRLRGARVALRPGRGATASGALAVQRRKELRRARSTPAVLAKAVDQVGDPGGDAGRPDRRLIEQGAHRLVGVSEADVGERVGRELVRQRGLERLERREEAARLGASLRVEDASRRER